MMAGQQRWGLLALCPYCDPSCRVAVPRGSGHHCSMRGLADISTVQASEDQPCQPSLHPLAYLDGVMGVRSFPMVWITLLPQTQSPIQMPTPP